MFRAHIENAICSALMDIQKKMLAAKTIMTTMRFPATQRTCVNFLLPYNNLQYTHSALFSDV
jgi:hypothetical protein